MDREFFQHIYSRQLNTESVPSNDEIATWALQLIRLLYPEQSRSEFSSASQVAFEFGRLEDELQLIMDTTKACRDCNIRDQVNQFFHQVPEIFRILNTDIQAIFQGDPAARSEFEVIKTYPGFFAICFYRLAHQLYRLDVPLIPRILTEYAHSKTGIDIHPGASIGEYFYIDHGTGIVIGETCAIGAHVKLYQGVTLGALSVDKSMASIKRHPTVQDRVVIYSGSTILGGDTVIGHDSVIGGNVWLTHSIDPLSTVYHTARITISTSAAQE